MSFLIEIGSNEAKTHLSIGLPKLFSHPTYFHYHNVHTALGDPLIKGLTEVANSRPPNPVKFLADYLHSIADNKKIVIFVFRVFCCTVRNYFYAHRFNSLNHCECPFSRAIISRKYRNNTIKTSNVNKLNRNQSQSRDHNHAKWIYPSMTMQMTMSYRRVMHLNQQRPVMNEYKPIIFSNANYFSMLTIFLISFRMNMVRVCCTLPVPVRTGAMR